MAQMSIKVLDRLSKVNALEYGHIRPKEKMSVQEDEPNTVLEEKKVEGDTVEEVAISWKTLVTHWVPRRSREDRQILPETRHVQLQEQVHVTGEVLQQKAP